jgi:hypothetical protein
VTPLTSRIFHGIDTTRSVQQRYSGASTRAIRLLKDVREASLRTDWTLLAGNHDERIRNTLIDWAVELYGVTKAQVDEDEQQPPVLSL